MFAPENPFLWLILELLDLYTYVIIAAVVASWLVGYGVINMHNQMARGIVQALYAITEPVFRPVRRMLPDLGGLDISPLIVLIAIMFLERLVVWAAVRLPF